MNRKWIAIVLAAALSLGGAAVWAAEPGDERPAADSAPVQTEPEAREPAPSQDRKPEAPEEPAAETFVTGPAPAGAVSFDGLDERVREGCLNYRILQESIDSIKANNYEKMEQSMRNGLSGLADAQWQMVSIPSKIVEGTGLPPALQGIVSLSTSAASDSLQAQYDALREQYDDLREGKFQEEMADKVRQMENTQNSILQLAESLFVQLKELDATDDTLDRSLAALDRQLQELELRHELGQVSALTLRQAQAGRTSLVSSRETLASSARTVRMNLASMLGADLTGEMSLGALPQVTDEQLAQLDLEADLAAAREASYTLYTEKKTLDDAQQDFKDAGKEFNYNEKNYRYVQAQHAWQAAQYTYDAAVESFELSFRTLYNQIQDYRQVLGAARTALALEKDNYAVDQLRYEQGTISKNALLTAQDDLGAAQDKVDTAKRNLFSAYNNYRWAVDYGILN